MTATVRCFLCRKALYEMPPHMAAYARVRCLDCQTEAAPLDAREIVKAQVNADKKRPGRKKGGV